MQPKKRKFSPRPAPITDECCQQMEKRFGINAEHIRQMAKQLGFGRPKMEMHLMVLESEARRKPVQ